MISTRRLDLKRPPAARREVATNSYHSVPRILLVDCSGAVSVQGGGGGGLLPKPDTNDQAAPQPAQAAISTTSNSDRQQKQPAERSATSPITSIYCISFSEGRVVRRAMEAVGLASAILTFTTVAVKVVRISHEIYSSGATAEYSHLSTVIGDLENVTSDLDADPTAIKDEKLTDLAAKCSRLSQDLLHLLRGLQPTDGGRLDSFKAAWAVARKQKTVDSIEKRLSQYRDQITMHLLVLLWCVFTPQSIWQ